MSNPDHLVLLPGMMCDMRIFAPQVDYFSGRLPMSVPRIHDASSMSALAEQVLEEAPPSFALVGYSMGGMVAMSIMDIAPERVTHLALMDTVHYPETPEAREFREPLIERARNGELAEFMEKEIIPMYLKKDHDPEHAKLVLDMAVRLGPDAFINQTYAILDRPDYEYTLQSNVSCPTLILCGGRDELATPEDHRAMAGMVYGAHLEVIPSVAHLTPIEAPKEVNSAIDALLKK